MENQETNNILEEKKYSVSELLKIISESKENNMEEDIKTLVEYFNKKQPQKENKNSLNITSCIDGLSLDDIRLIHEYAVKEVEKYTKSPFDISKDDHKDYYEYFKQQALKSKEIELKIQNFESELYKKYGDMYENVEKAARDAFENMAFRDARDILSSRMHGNVEKLLEFYDNVFKEISLKENNVEKEEILFPPKSINGGSCKFNETKPVYEDFI